MCDNYCEHCGRKVPVWIRDRTVTIKYATRTTRYDESYAICQFCGKEVHDLTVEDMNTKRRAFALSANQA